MTFKKVRNFAAVAAVALMVTANINATTAVVAESEPMVDVCITTSFLPNGRTYNIRESLANHLVSTYTSHPTISVVHGACN